MTTSAYIGLGSNVGDRLGHLKRAVVLLEASPGIRVGRCSAVYDTDPVGPAQDDFLNAVVEVHTILAPRELLGRCKEIEREVGRLERERWGPREVDLDLLLYGTEEVESDDLRIPHPQIASRAFVLVPLADIVPFARIGDAGLVAQLLESVDRSGVRPAHRPETIWP